MKKNFCQERQNAIKKNGDQVLSFPYIQPSHSQLQKQCKGTKKREKVISTASK